MACNDAFPCFDQVNITDNMVSAVNRISLMTTDTHCHLSWNTGIFHVTDCGSPEVMEERASVLSIANVAAIRIAPRA